MHELNELVNPEIGHRVESFDDVPVKIVTFLKVELGEKLCGIKEDESFIWDR